MYLYKYTFYTKIGVCHLEPHVFVYLIKINTTTNQHLRPAALKVLRRFLDPFKCTSMQFHHSPLLYLTTIMWYPCIIDCGRVGWMFR